MKFKKIEFGSDEFRQECALRNEVLRKPLGLDIHDEDIEQEKNQLHFGLFDADGQLIGCAVAVPFSGFEAKIRQMAVAGDHQRKGYGRRIMIELERRLARRGFIHLVLHARLTAVGFYRKLGYSVVGEQFMEIAIPHVRMEKNLLPL